MLDEILFPLGHNCLAWWYCSLLSLSMNEFTGTLPPSLTALTALSVLDTTFNQLSGDVPSWLVNMPYFT